MMNTLLDGMIKSLFFGASVEGEMGVVVEERRT